MTCRRPILMSASMVRALLDGRKTQTRRIAKFPKWADPSGGVEFCSIDSAPAMLCRESGCFADVNSPFGLPGDSLWVRETWRVARRWDDNPPRTLPFERGMTIMYAAGGSRAHNGAGVYENDDDYPPELPEWAGKQRPSIHMPRWASRLTLKITEVRIEQLHDISNEDAAAEGWPGPDETGTIRSSYPMAWYSHLWESINGRGSWEFNPWVWALTFEVVK